MPENEDQAQVYVIMAASQLNQNDYLLLLNDFIAAYPKNTEGYLRRASIYMNMGDEAHYALAEEDLETMKKEAEKKEEACYNIAKLLYTYQLGLKGNRPTRTGRGNVLSMKSMKQSALLRNLFITRLKVISILPCRNIRKHLTHIVK